MSLRLRVRYQVRSFAQFILSFRVPAILTGNFAKITITSAIVFLLVGYIVQISHLTTSGYEIASLEKKTSALNDETQKLATEVAAYQSISSIQKRLGDANMVPASHITYVKTSVDTAVAQR